MKRFILKGAVAALFSFSALVVHAGYAQLAPPPGWSQGAYGGQFSFGNASNSATLANGTVRTNAALSVGGRAVSIPASLRFAANAPRVAASYGVRSPWVIAALTVGSIAYNWYQESGYRLENGQWQRKDPSICTAAPCYEYKMEFHPSAPGSWSSSQEAACQSAVAAYAAIAPQTQTVFLSFQGATCSARRTAPDWNDTITTVAQSRSTAPKPDAWKPATLSDLQNLEDVLAQKPIPDDLPEKLPGIEWPVEIPVINPSPDVNPLPDPLFVPTGNPIPNPNYNPNAPPGPENMPWLQPGYRIIPNPTPWAPWQVDIRPVNRPVPYPTPDWTPYPDRIPNPWDIPDPSRDESEDFCTKNPTSLACEKGDFTDKELPKIPKLYERKYPNGMVGIWEQKKEILMSSGLGTIAGAMMPTGMSSGSCPSFQLDLSLVSWADYGVRDVAPPCWVWDFGKVVILILAVIKARQLIFGG